MGDPIGWLRGARAAEVEPRPASPLVLPPLLLPPLRALLLPAGVLRRAEALRAVVVRRAVAPLLLPAGTTSGVTALAAGTAAGLAAAGVLAAAGLAAAAGAGVLVPAALGAAAGAEAAGLLGMAMAETEQRVGRTARGRRQRRRWGVASAIGLPEVDDAADRQIGMGLGITTGKACR